MSSLTQTHSDTEKQRKNKHTGLFESFQPQFLQITKVLSGAKLILSYGSLNTSQGILLDVHE